MAEMTIEEAIEYKDNCFKAIIDKVPQQEIDIVLLQTATAWVRLKNWLQVDIDSPGTVDWWRDACENMLARMKECLKPLPVTDIDRIRRWASKRPGNIEKWELDEFLAQLEQEKR